MASSNQTRTSERGVSAAFEFQDVDGTWKPITDPYTTDQLKRLCANNSTTSVTYRLSSAAGTSYTAHIEGGAIVQTNSQTKVRRNLRLVAFNFEYLSSGSWNPVTDVSTIQALTSLLASTLPQRYRLGEFEYEARLENNQGRITQRNLSTGNETPLRASCIGPDGEPHFEYREGPVGTDEWKRVPRGPPTQAIHAVATGQCVGRATYSNGSFHYEAYLDPSTGFVVSRNVQSGTERPIRPAPWLGHGAPMPAPTPAAPTLYPQHPAQQQPGAPVVMGTPVSGTAAPPGTVPQGVVMGLPPA